MTYRQLPYLPRRRTNCENCGKRRLCTRIEWSAGKTVKIVQDIWWCNDCLAEKTIEGAFSA